MFVQNTVEHPDYPISKGVVRMSLNKCVKVRQLENAIETEEYSTFDMGGYFPSRLMNVMISASMKAGVPLLRKQLEEAN